VHHEDAATHIGPLIALGTGYEAGISGGRVLGGSAGRRAGAFFGNKKNAPTPGLIVYRLVKMLIEADSGFAFGVICKHFGLLTVWLNLSII
jgi:hypothetical protein